MGRMVGSHIRMAPLNGWVKTDNRHLDEKIKIRRYFLDKYPLKTYRVIDCCAGEQAIWGILRRHYPIQYTGLDKNRVDSGVVKIAAERWLRDVEWSADVLDIDPYGEPWPIYFAALENYMGEDLTVFLTNCNAPIKTVRLMSKSVRAKLGIPEKWKIWHSKKISDMATQACLSHVVDCGFEVVEAKKIVLPDRAEWCYMYMGMRLRWLKK